MFLFVSVQCNAVSEMSKTLDGFQNALTTSPFFLSWFTQIAHGRIHATCLVCLALCFISCSVVLSHAIKGERAKKREKLIHLLCTFKPELPEFDESKEGKPFDTTHPNIWSISFKFVFHVYFCIHNTWASHTSCINRSGIGTSLIWLVVTENCYRHQAWPLWWQASEAKVINHLVAAPITPSTSHVNKGDSHRLVRQTNTSSLRE